MIREFVIRLSSPTPRFYRSLRNLGLALFVIGGVLALMPEPVAGVLPEAAPGLCIAGAVMALVAQTGTAPWHLQKKRGGRYVRGYVYERRK